MNDEVSPLGLGARLADPVSIWPKTTVIELAPEAAARLGDEPVEALRAALARQGGVALARIGGFSVVRTEHGGALVHLDSDSEAMRALHVASRRRATSAAEALHAAVLDLD